jgi:hypothetical protein
MIAGAAKVVPYAKAIAFGLAACVVCSLVSFGAGVWAGIEWQQGKSAQVENRALKTDVEGLLQAAVALRQRGVDIAQDFRTAHRRMEAISDEYAQRDLDHRRFFDAHRDALGELVAAQPGLRDDCLGDAGVQHWNAAARGPGAAGAATERGAEQAPAVPRGAAGAEGGQRGSDPAGMDPRGGTVPGVRDADAGAGGSAAGLRNGSVAPLLRGDLSTRPRRAGLREVRRG